jgi:signal transduction histidine kinase
MAHHTQSTSSNLAHITDTVMVVIYDLSRHQFHHANPAAQRFMGLGIARLNTPQNSIDLQYIHPDDRALARQYFAEAAHNFDLGYSGKRLNIRIRNAAGVWRWVAQQVTVFQYADSGQPEKLLIIGLDITDELTTGAAAKMLSGEASLPPLAPDRRTLNYLHEGLVNHINHEFRTPLTVINASAEFLDRYFDDLSPERRLMHVRRIREQVGRILHMYDSLYDYQRWRTYLADEHRYSFDLHAVCVNAADLLKNDMDETLHFQIVPNTPLPCEGCTVLIEMVILAVFRNAAQASLLNDDNYILIGLSSDENTATVSVTDQGVGINAADWDHIYKPFYRGRNTRSVPGLGLGLTLVDEVLRAINGDIDIRSAPQHGTTVTVNLPRWAA